MNFIAIKGRLVRDPEMKHTNSGKSVCNITVAVDRNYKREGAQNADFFTCVLWEKTAEFVGKYFTKGKEIIITGEMQSRQWEDKDGNKRTAWEIQNCRAEFCGSKDAVASGAKEYGTASLPEYTAAMVPVDDDSDLPF